MKNYYADDYCPQREKVLDLSRSVLSGGRRYARHRRTSGRYLAKLERQVSREQLARAAKWQCLCGGDPEIDCGRCFSDDLPTICETHDAAGLPKFRGYEKTSRYTGFADDLGQIFRWYKDRTGHLDHVGAEAFLRQMLLASPFGHSLKTRHAYDHLFVEVQRFRRNDYSCRRCWVGCCCPRVGPVIKERQPD